MYQQDLEDVYPVVFIDAVHFSVKKEGIIRKHAAYVVLGVDIDGRKDIMVLCAGGLTGIKERISVAFKKAEYQHCLVHQVRNTLKHVPHKDKKAFAKDLKAIYHAPTQEKGRETMLEVAEKWRDK